MPVSCIEISVGGRACVRRTLVAPCAVVIGSSSDCDLRVLAVGVRAKHLVVEWDGSTVTVRSPEGTSSGGAAAGAPFERRVSGTASFRVGQATVTVTAPPPDDDDAPTLVLPERDVTQVSLPAVERDERPCFAPPRLWPSVRRAWASFVLRAHRMACPSTR